MIRNLLVSAILASAAALSLSSCDKNGNVSLISTTQDVELGRQTDSLILATPAEYPILPVVGNEQLYAYVRGLKDKILATGKVQYKDEFKWEVKIINKADVLNAFCTPGGYIYVYTGLIKYLDNGDQLAGVMGHEMGHADLRHSSRQITKDAGISVVLSVILGKSAQGAAAQVLTQVAGLRFSRDYEREADKASVTYLSGTEYNCAGAAGFFEKLTAEANTQNPPQWLSTHPNPENRVKDINEQATKLGCNKSSTTVAEYAQIKALVP
jgi:beta-barrel assembly-enhancing protease